MTASSFTGQILRAVAGVWQGDIAGAFMYGLGLITLDLGFGWCRFRLARLMGRSRLGRFLGLTFITRLCCYLAGIALAARIFSRPELFLVCILIVLALPARILALDLWFRHGEG